MPKTPRRPPKDIGAFDPLQNATNEQATRRSERYSRARRRLLQSMAAGGASVTVKTVAEQWVAPILHTATLPAHARTTCQVESLQCQVSAVNAAWSGTSSNIRLDPNPPIDGGESLEVRRMYLNIGNVCTAGDPTGTVTSATLTVNASITPASCGPVDLRGSMSPSDEFDLDAGGNQTGVVDPDSGAVSFGNVVVGVTLPEPTSSDSPNPVSANLALTVAAPGVPDCVINVTFTENTGWFCGG